MTRADESAMRDGRRLTLVRNATVILELDGRRLLVDPMLDAVGVQPPVENTDNERRNPLVPLPIPADQVVADLDAVLVTHLHRDPFDDGPSTTSLATSPSSANRKTSSVYDFTASACGQFTGQCRKMAC